MPEIIPGTKPLNPKALVLFSGGLDSRLVIKILQEQNIDVKAVFFLLPFGEGCCNSFSCVFNFSQTQNIKLHVIDCTKNPLFEEYLEIIKNPKFKTGKGINPCIDCRIFLLKKTKELNEKIKADFIATGEVLDERPMSQHKKALLIIEKEAGLEGKVLRPLSAKLLPETEAEKQKIIDREKLFSIQGRQRKEQIKLAEKFNIKYPNPAGGCLLCEKDFSKKILDLFNNKKEINHEEIQLLKIGRHFRINGKIIIGRNKKENDLIEKLNEKLKYFLIKQTRISPAAVFENDKEITKKLIEAYSSDNLDLRENFNEFKI